ncbi:MAG: 5-(carboxyamino)imidazole ribonucleotide mutase [Planctomycetes bacterium]|nr:5-(carboxyamino)imidazole ribonucleotide mutase [Planctomycetota bacterium]
MNPRVAIVVGSDSDLPHLEGCLLTLKEFEVPFEVRVLSAHRTPERAHEFARDASGRGIQILIAAAGGAAHLAGTLAAASLVPVIGVPVPAPPLCGLDALLSTVQMPAGIPVATVAVGKSGGTNAAVLAVQILALGDSGLRSRLERYRLEMRRKVEAKDEAVRARESFEPKAP